MEQAPKIASKNSKNDVQTHILQYQNIGLVLSLEEREFKGGQFHVFARTTSQRR